MRADNLLGPAISDVDGNVEERRGTVSVFNGPSPAIEVTSSIADECAIVSRTLLSWLSEGLAAHEIGVFVRSDAELPRAKAAVDDAQIPWHVVGPHMKTVHDQLCITTMHLAKGLEFRGVAVIACDDESVLLRSRIEAVVDEADLEDVYPTERQLLYVACTRARDRLVLIGVEPGSEFLDDL